MSCSADRRLLFPLHEDQQRLHRHRRQQQRQCRLRIQVRRRGMRLLNSHFSYVNLFVPIVKLRFWRCLVYVL